MTDITVTECDTCGKRTEDEYHDGWHKLYARRKGDVFMEQDVLHFCSLECLKEWVEKHQPKDNAAIMHQREATP